MQLRGRLFDLRRLLGCQLGRYQHVHGLLQLHHVPRWSLLYQHIRDDRNGRGRMSRYHTGTTTADCSRY